MDRNDRKRSDQGGTIKDEKEMKRNEPFHPYATFSLDQCWTVFFPFGSIDVLFCSTVQFTQFMDVFTSTKWSGISNITIDCTWDLDWVGVMSSTENGLFQSNKIKPIQSPIFAVRMPDVVSKEWLVRVGPTNRFYGNHPHQTEVSLLESHIPTTWKWASWNLLNVLNVGHWRGTWLASL